VTDFPAAHSMDTTWFAIDADGCVGIFDSSEGGAVPKDLTKVTNNEIEFEGDLLELLAKDSGRLIDREAIDLEFILQSMSLENLLTEIRENEKSRQEHSRTKEFDIYGLFLAVTTEEVITELQQQSATVIELYRDSTKIILYSGLCELAWLRQAIASGKVLSGSKEFDLEYNLNLLGWYSYDCGEQYPDTYDREKLPKKPVYFKDLSPEISQHIKLTKFPNLRFAQTKAIQPIEHMPCHTWGTENWQGTDGEWHEGFPEYPAPTSTDLI
jgi:hypothetical protein